MTDATNMNGPLTPDWSYDCNQVELLDKIQALETTTPAVSINNFSVLQEKHSKDEQDASVHGKLLLDVQTNLRTEMQLRAETEEKLSQGHCASQQSTTQERDQLTEELAECKEYAEKRSKQLEGALAKEKSLNDERKRKMKQFVETKT